jgi:hypothetical protein
MDALRTLYPQIITTLDDKAFDINGNEVEYDAEAVATKAQEMQEAAVTAKQTAISKLSALGLTDAEIKALTGISI